MLQAWQECSSKVQQQDAPAQQMLESLDTAYPHWLLAGATYGTAIGFGMGAASSGWGAFAGASLGLHIGLIAADQWHTLAMLTLSTLANLPPSASAVAAACGPKPSN